MQVVRKVNYNIHLYLNHSSIAVPDPNLVSHNDMIALQVTARASCPICGAALSASCALSHDLHNNPVRVGITSLLGLQAGVALEPGLQQTHSPAAALDQL